MIILMGFINRMFALGYTESQVIQELADLEANAFGPYIQRLANQLEFVELTANQVQRLCESVDKWESALHVCQMRKVG